MSMKLALPALVLSLAAGPALADIVPGTVSTDAFDSTQGTIVVAHDTIIDPINAFRTTGGFEDGHVLMRNGGLGSMSFIDFRTAGPVTLQGMRLFAHNDGVPFAFRRAMSRFTLLADLDGDLVAETTVASMPINPDYALQPGNVATDPTNLDLTIMLGSAVTATDWRIEIIQGSNVQPFEGARLVELDALALDCGTCDALQQAIADMDVDVEGVRNSFSQQAAAACRALDRSQPETAGNVLCALLHHLDAQDGKHVAAASAAALRDCVHAFAEANSIELPCEGI